MQRKRRKGCACCALRYFGSSGPREPCLRGSRFPLPVREVYMLVLVPVGMPLPEPELRSMLAMRTVLAMDLLCCNEKGAMDLRQ